MQPVQSHRLPHLLDPFPRLSVFNLGGGQGDAVFFKDRCQHRFERIHFAFFGMHGADQLFDMPQFMATGNQAVTAGQAAQFKTIGIVAAQRGGIVLNNAAILAGGTDFWRHLYIRAGAHCRCPVTVAHTFGAFAAVLQIKVALVGRADKAVINTTVAFPG